MATLRTMTEGLAMREEEIATLLQAKESAGLEFKKSLADTRRIVQTIAAMATVRTWHSAVLTTDRGRPM